METPIDEGSFPPKVEGEGGEVEEEKTEELALPLTEPNPIDSLRGEVVMEVIQPMEELNTEFY